MLATASVIASLRSGSASVSPRNKGILYTLPYSGDAVAGFIDGTHPQSGDMLKMVRSVAVRFATRSVDNRSVIHWADVDDMVQSVRERFADYQNRGMHPADGWASFGLYLYIFTLGVCKDFVKGAAKQNPNRLFTRVRDTEQLPINELRARRAGSVSDRVDFVIRCIDSERSTNTLPEGITLTETEQDVISLSVRGLNATQIGVSLSMNAANVRKILQRIRDGVEV